MEDMKVAAARERGVNSLLVLASAVIGCLLMEFLVSRTLISLPRDLFLMGFSAQPGVAIDGIQINYQGFAGDTIDHPKPAGSLRILTLGGSSFFNSDITVRLKARLEANLGKPVEVAGGALRSHTSASSLVKYTRYFSQYDVDYVLIYDGMNDLWANHVAADKFQDDYSHLYPEYKRTWLLEHCVICRVIYNAVSVSPPRVYLGSGFVSERTFESNLRQLIEAIYQNGSVPVLMTFAISIPESYTHEKFARGEAGYSKNLTGNDFWSMEGWGEPADVREGISRHNRVIRKLASEYQLNIIDQQSLLNGNPEYFGDVCHFSESGVEVFIDNISHFFMKNK